MQHMRAHLGHISGRPNTTGTRTCPAIGVLISTSIKLGAGALLESSSESKGDLRQVTCHTNVDVTRFSIYLDLERLGACRCDSPIGATLNRIKTN